MGVIGGPGGHPGRDPDRLGLENGEMAQLRRDPRQQLGQGASVTDHSNLAAWQRTVGIPIGGVEDAAGEFDQTGDIGPLRLRVTALSGEQHPRRGRRIGKGDDHGHDRSGLRQEVTGSESGKRATA